MSVPSLMTGSDLEFDDGEKIKNNGAVRVSQSLQVLEFLNAFLLLQLDAGGAPLPKL